MYQYGNVAVQYQKDKQNRPGLYKQPNKNPHNQPIPTKRFSPAEKAVYLLAVVSVVTTLCILLHSHASIAQVNYDIQFLEKEIVKVDERNDELKLQIAELSSPDRILKIAKEQWGLSINESPVKVLSTPVVKVAAVSNDQFDVQKSQQEAKDE